MTTTDTPIKSFLEIPYDQLEEKNLDLKKKTETATAKEIQKEHITYLTKETKIKALTVCFTDMKADFICLIMTRNFFWTLLKI